jgi:hypothetical protein
MTQVILVYHISSFIISYTSETLNVGYLWQLYIIGHYLHSLLIIKNNNNLTSFKIINICKHVSYFI